MARFTVEQFGPEDWRIIDGNTGGLPVMGTNMREVAIEIAAELEVDGDYQRVLDELMPEEPLH